MENGWVGTNKYLIHFQSIIREYKKVYEDHFNADKLGVKFESEMPC